MIKPAPKTKSDYYKRWFKGEFGNKPRTWDTLQALMEDPYDGLVTIRFRDIGNPSFAPYLTKSQILDRLQVPKSRWSETANFTFNESMPDDRVVIQGFIMRSTLGLEFHYSMEQNVPCSMRFWKKSRIVYGVSAYVLLRDYMPAPDREHLEWLLDTYGGVVEFTTFEMPVGYDKLCTIFWEVRDY